MKGEDRSLIDKEMLASCFLNNRVTLVCLGAAVVLFSYILMVTFTKPQWEAIGLVKVGQVGVYPSDVRDEKAVPIVPILNVLEKLKMKSSIDEASKALSDNDQVQELFQNSLKVKLTTSGYLEVKVRGYNAESAKRFVQQLVDQLKVEHDQLLKEKSANYLPILDHIQQEVLVVRRINENLNRMAKGSLGSDASLKGLLLTDLSLQYQQSLTKLLEQEIVARERMGPAFNFPTNLIGEISVSKSPVYPNKIFNAIFSVFIGLLTVFFVLFLKTLDAMSIISPWRSFADKNSKPSYESGMSDEG